MKTTCSGLAGARRPVPAHGIPPRNCGLRTQRRLPPGSRLPRLPAGLARRRAVSQPAGRLHAAARDAELSEQFRLVEVQVEAGDLAVLEFVDAAEKRADRPAGRGDLAGRTPERTGVRADEAALVH